MEAVQKTPEREAFYRKIDGENLSALWNVLGDLVTPEPRSACRPHLWKFDAIRDYMTEAGKLITAKEAGQYLSLSTDTIYRLASQKKLPYLKIGDRVLFDVKALDHWIEKHMVKEKDWKRQELKIETDEKKASAKPAKESDLLDFLKKKGKT